MTSLDMLQYGTVKRQLSVSHGLDVRDTLHEAVWVTDGMITLAGMRGVLTVVSYW